MIQELKNKNDQNFLKDSWVLTIFFNWLQKIILTSGLPRLMKNGISQFLRLDITVINT